MEHIDFGDKTLMNGTPSIPPNTKAQCNICDWVGRLKDCPTEMDSEGWEYPEYEVLICPACGEGDVNI